jgi:hypothetical protein
MCRVGAEDEEGFDVGDQALGNLRSGGRVTAYLLHTSRQICMLIHMLYEFIVYDSSYYGFLYMKSYLEKSLNSKQYEFKFILVIKTI